MCGKFTAMASWAEMVDLSQPPTGERFEKKDGSDREVAYRVMTNLPIILFDHGAGIRRVAPMRWGFPHRENWRRPQPIHARSETIEATRAFAEAFRDGQRGIVLMRTFNEAPNVEGPTVQHMIAPDCGMLAAAFLWRRFEIAGQPQPMFACVMVTVPANGLIAGLPTDRMPAFLAPDDWAVWLGEEAASLERVKACLKTVDDAGWTMTPERRAKSAPRAKPTISDPAGLF
jgi:putative SOS response-associated peptidase YedK